MLSLLPDEACRRPLPLAAAACRPEGERRGARSPFCSGCVATGAGAGDQLRGGAGPGAPTALMTHIPRELKAAADQSCCISAPRKAGARRSRAVTFRLHAGWHRRHHHHGGRLRLGHQGLRVALQGPAGRSRARDVSFSRKVMDFSAYLASHGLTPDAPGFANERRVVYQDACHLLHAQGQQQRAALTAGRHPKLALASSIADAGTCCGSAGTYNIDQPAIAAELAPAQSRRRSWRPNRT